MLATPFCPQTKGEIFVSGTEPMVMCPLHSGGGEPSPYWQHDSDTLPGDQPTISPEKQKDQKKEKDKGIRRLLHIIFGNGQ
jgi:hypothetical protein